MRARARPRWWHALPAALLAVCGTGGMLVLAGGDSAAAPSGRVNWITTWMAAPQPAVPGSRAARGFGGQTVRETVLASLGGSAVRVELTNRYGRLPLTVGAATIAAHGEAPQPLRFLGNASISIPPGAVVLSDPLALSVPDASALTLSVYVPGRTGPVTGNADAGQTAYAAPGDQTAAPLVAPSSPYLPIGSASYLLGAIDVAAAAGAPGAVVALGDSITAGVGSRTNGFDAWPDDLARRLIRARVPVAVLDAGIGGNRVLNNAPCCGFGAVARFGQDVSGHAGVRAVILLEGVNDIGFTRHRDAASLPHTDESAAQIIAGLQMIVTLAHADGLRIDGATLTPFAGARYWSPDGEAKRDAINAWILHSGAFDRVLDLAAAVADPADPQRLDPRYDSGDHLHPDAAGYARMAAAIPAAAILAAVR